MTENDASRRAKRRETFVTLETLLERGKREKRTSEVKKLLSDTAKYRFALGIQIRDLKSYMDLEFESGIRTMEMCLIRELEHKSKELKHLSDFLSTKESQLDSDTEITRLEAEKQWLSSRVSSLYSHETDLKIAFATIRDRVSKLKSHIRTCDTELRCIRRENISVENQLRSMNEAVHAQSRSVNVPKIVLSLPIRMLEELSPRRVGGLRVQELSGYKSFCDSVSTLKTKLKTSKQLVRDQKLQFLAKTATPIFLEKLYNDCFEVLMAYAFEAKTHRNIDLKSNSGARTESRTLAAEGREELYRVAGVLGQRREVADVLKRMVFKRMGGTARSRKMVMSPRTGLQTASLSSFAGLSPELWNRSEA